jgi:hypothetical protein
MNRQSRTHDTVLFKSRKRTGWTQTLPWGLGGEGVKTTENKIHGPVAAASVSAPLCLHRYYAPALLPLKSLQLHKCGNFKFRNVLLVYVQEMVNNKYVNTLFRNCEGGVPSCEDASIPSQVTFQKVFSPCNSAGFPSTSAVDPDPDFDLIREVLDVLF